MVREVKMFELYKPFKRFLSEGEYKDLNLFRVISHDSLMHILKNDDVIIKSCIVDRNTYGEFMFITFYIDGRYYTVYGLGLHEYKGRVYRNEWNVFMANDYIYKDKETIPFEKVEMEIMRRIDQIRNLSGFKNKDTVLFNFISELAGDDYYAIVELCDCYWGRLE